MTSVVMSSAMEANVRAQVRQCVDAAVVAIEHSYTNTTASIPMPAITETITFRVNDGVTTREFTFVMSLTELSSTGTTPTSGHDVVTH